MPTSSSGGSGRNPKNGRPSGTRDSSGQLPRGSRPTVAPIQFQSEPKVQAEASPPRATRSSNLTLMVAAVLLAAAGTVVAVRIVQMQKTGAARGAGVPAEYAVACRVCQERFPMSAGDFDEALKYRTNRSANRVKCPKCGAEDAVFRTESGMAGQGELGPDGFSGRNPRLAKD